MRPSHAAILAVAISCSAFGQTYTYATVAGTLATPGYTGDNGFATSAELSYPWGIALDSAGNLYVADTNNSVIRKVSVPLGVITTYAGNNTAAFGGDNGQAAAAELNVPSSLAVDSAGNLYIADYFNERVRKVAASTGIITTYAGNGTSGYSGDGGPASSAELGGPIGIALDSAGNLYIAEAYNYRIRKVAASTGVITTVAGNGTAGYSGDNGPALGAEFRSPSAVAVDAAGNLYIADTDNDCIREVAISTGVITTVAGIGTSGNSGDNGPATKAQLSAPRGIAVDSAGNIYIADFGNNSVRKVASGVIATIAGGGGGFAGAGTVNGVSLTSPIGLIVSAGDVYIADTANQRIVELIPSPPAFGGIVNSASYAGGGVAPGEIVAIFGSGMGPSTPSSLQLNSSGAVSTSLAGVQVLFGGVAAPLVYAQAGQINAVVPYEVSGETSTQVQLTYLGESSTPLALPVVAAAPGIFTLNEGGTGAGVVLNQDGTLNSSANAAAAGSVVTIYATGEGQTNPKGVDGLLDPSPAPQPLQTVTATVGGLAATVESASGVAGGVAGLLQVKLQIPAGLIAGNAALVLDVGGLASQPEVTISVQGSGRTASSERRR